MKAWLLSIAGLIFSGAGLCWAYPEPAVVQTLDNWTVGVVFDQPEQITVNIPGQGEKRFWYIILTLTNNSGQGAVPFYPKCELMTDTFQIIQAGKDVRQNVFEQIKLLHQGKYPFLQYFGSVGNKILEGVDNTVDLAIIWSDFDSKAKEASLFIGGLSNETVAVEHPLQKDTQGKAVKVYLSKTLELTYTIGGDPNLRQQAGLKFRSKRWVMR